MENIFPFIFYACFLQTWDKLYTVSGKLCFFITKNILNCNFVTCNGYLKKKKGFFFFKF